MRNFKSIDCLRAYMAWWVVLGHAAILAGANTFLPQPVYDFLNSGGHAVNVFIIISGFVITHLLLSKNERYLPYITRRAFRIFPIYLLCLLVALAIPSFYVAAYIDLPWAVAPEMRLDRLASEHDFFGIHLLLHLVMLHGVLPTGILPFSESAFLAPAWSLSLEWQFYLVAPFLIPLLLRSSLAMIVTCLVLLVLNRIAQAGYLGDWRYLSFLPLALPYFLIGILSRAALQYRNLAAAGPELLIVLAGIALLFVGSLEAMIWVAFLASAMAEDSRARFTVPIVQRLVELVTRNQRVAEIGTWSYSTYLIHIPVFSLAVGAYAKLDGTPSQAVAVGILAACLPVVLLVSRVLFERIETPFNRLGQQIARRMQPAAA